MFLQVSVCPQGGEGHVWLRGVCMVTGGHAWLPGGCVWLPGGMRGWGACMVAGGLAWLAGGVHGCGGCVVGGGHAWLPGGMHGCEGGVHGCQGGVRMIRRDTVNEQAVRILLECILVCSYILQPASSDGLHHRHPSRIHTD